MNNICSYCGRLNKTKSDAYLTREHITPAFMIESETEYHETVYFEKEIKVPSPAKIKDVCNYCNNGVLSDLDAYGKQLYETFFYEDIKYSSKVFSYDFHKLIRWLLKISYNNNRVVNTEQAFQKYTNEIIEYILGDRLQLDKLIAFGNIVPSQRIKNTRLRDQCGNNNDYIKPSRLRISNIEFSNHAEPRFSRLIAIHNFYFSIFYPVNLDELPNEIQKDYVLLNDKEKVILKKMKKSFLDSLDPTFRRFPNTFEKFK